MLWPSCESCSIPGLSLEHFHTQCGGNVHHRSAMSVESDFKNISHLQNKIAATKTWTKKNYFIFKQWMIKLTMINSRAIGNKMKNILCIYLILAIKVGLKFPLKNLKVRNLLLFILFGINLDIQSNLFFLPFFLPQEEKRGK